jgi:RNA polymerase sigma-70 factor, ECF subfamily
MMAPDQITNHFGRGDPDGLTRLYDEFGGLVYGCAFRVLKDGGLAEEATQETFVRAWLHAESFDRARPVAPWLAVISKRVALDILRREIKRTHGNLTDAPELGITDKAMLFDDSWLVRETLESLAEPDRDLIRMMYFDDKPESEIAEELAIPAGTVKSRAHAARQKLRRALAGKIDEHSKAQHASTKTTTGWNTKMPDVEMRDVEMRDRNV